MKRQRVACKHGVVRRCYSPQRVGSAHLGGLYFKTAQITKVSGGCIAGRATDRQNSACLLERGRGANCRDGYAYGADGSAL
eukprot:scaffold9073_cov33-Prasinocladus_malaysianus.AAC.3